MERTNFCVFYGAVLGLHERVDTKTAQRYHQGVVPMLRSTVRRFSSTVPRRAGKIGKKFENAAEIKEFLSRPSWKVHDMIPDPDKVKEEITPRLVEKLLKQSGLDHNISQEEYQKLEKSLRTQIGFINHLYNESEDHGEQKESNSEVFRLLASDHHPPEPLTLSKLMEQVESLQSKDIPEEKVPGEFNKLIKFKK